MLAGFWGATVVQVAAVAFDVKILKQASKMTLMPLLWQWSRTQDAPPLLQAALLASAAGDLLLETDLQLAGMAAFAAAHACYLAVFLANPAQRSWRVLAAYAALWAALIAVLSPGLGNQRVPVAVYALLLTATAVASRWHNSRSGAGRRALPDLRRPDRAPPVRPRLPRPRCAHHVDVRDRPVPADVRSHQGAGRSVR